MKLSLWGIGVILLVFGFLSGTTVYYYRQAQLVSSQKSSSDKSFSGTHPEITNEVSENIRLLSVPAEPRNALTYSAHTYKINSGESLYSIATKFGLPQALLKRANSITDENRLEAGKNLDIPVISEQTDLYRLEFLLNETTISEYNAMVREATTDELFDPVQAARKFAVGYFNLKNTDDFHLFKADLSKGESTVEVDSVSGNSYIVGLIQPKAKGDKGFWVMLYIEEINE